ncbi:MAG: FtsX-like permease family protein [Bradyrhizobiaceae bacterium]|nr:MAG: FtsX-like permease family protein [Bradyrhizobiaceae bacterium]
MGNGFSLALRFALREWRGGLRGFHVFVACIALGVFAIAGIGSISASLSDGLSRQARVLLGGDITFALFQREATTQELSFLHKQGEVSRVATLRGMARTAHDDFSLIDIKAVDDRHPLLGELTLEPQMPLSDIFAQRDGHYGAAVDPVLLARLNLKLGDTVSVGQTTFQIRSSLTAEPDKLLGGITIGPRVLISIDALKTTGLLQPGALVRWTYRVKLANPNETAVTQLTERARQQFPQAGWEIRNSLNASPQLERNVSRFTQFLTLVGLAALLIGGIGVVNAVRSHLERKRDVIATYKALGASARMVFAIYLIQVLLLALLGSLIGAALGAALPYAVLVLFGHLLPLPLEASIYPATLALALGYGILAALAFALWPLGRVRDIPAAVLFRAEVSDEMPRMSPRQLVTPAAAIALLAAAAVLLAYDRKIAAIFVGVSLVVFLLLRVVAWLTMAIARRVPRPDNTMLRLALTNIYRPGALTPSVVLSLGLGLAALVTVTQIDANLRRQFSAALPERAPSFYFLDIPSAQSANFSRFVGTLAPDSKVEVVPMLRGRITAVKGIPAEQLKPSSDAEWVLQSDRGISYADKVPEGSKIVAGNWWAPDYDGKPLVSLEQKIADGLGIGIGDEITVNVLGRNITATVGNLRSVDWQNLGINFVLVFSPNTFAGAPHTDLATLTANLSTPADDANVIREVAHAFPSVTSVRVRDALKSIGDIVTNLTLAIRGASLVTLIAALLVLGGALAAGHRHRVYDAVILKTLGAVRRQLIGAYAAEYALIGLATAVFGVAAGSVAAWQIVTRLMHLSFTWEAATAALVAAAALALTIGLGLIGTFMALRLKPAAVLRNL